MATYIVPTDKKPSFFNKHTVIGALVGTLVGQTGFGAVLGASIGGFVGYTGQHIEQKHGHVVREPNVVNDGMGIGALTGGIIAGLTVAAFSLALPASVVVGFGMMALGGYLGGKAGELAMKKEYDEAEHLAFEGKAKIVGLIDVTKQPGQVEIYGKKPQIATETPQPLALPEPEPSHYRTDHAARLRAQQLQQHPTGRSL